MRQCNDSAMVHSTMPDDTAVIAENKSNEIAGSGR